MGAVGSKVEVALGEMGAVGSKAGIALGLVICLGAGVAIGALHGKSGEDSGRRGLEESEQQAKAVQAEFGAARKMAAELDGSQRGAKAPQAERAAERNEENELQNQAAQCRVQALEKELAATRRELEEVRCGALANKAAHDALLDQVVALKSERDDCEESVHRVKSLQAELEATRKVATSFNRRAQQELESARRQLQPLKAEQDAMVKSNSEALRQVKALEEEQGHLQRELAQSRQQRKQSCSDLTHISKKLENVGSRWAPWNDIKDIKGKVERLKSASNEDLEQLRGA